MSITLSPSSILPNTVLKNLGEDNEQCLVGVGTTIKANSMGVLGRLCYAIAPTLYLGKSHQRALESLQQSISRSTQNNDEDWAALVLQKAGVGKLVVIEGRLKIQASALITKKCLDQIITFSSMTKSELIRDQSKQLKYNVKEALKKRRGLSENSFSTIKKQNLNTYTVTPLQPTRTLGLKPSSIQHDKSYLGTEEELEPLISHDGDDDDTEHFDLTDHLSFSTNPTNSINTEEELEPLISHDGDNDDTERFELTDYLSFATNPTNSINTEEELESLISHDGDNDDTERFELTDHSSLSTNSTNSITTPQIGIQETFHPKNNTAETIPSSEFQSDSVKETLTYAQWSADKKSHSPIAYALKCIDLQRPMEPDTITFRLMPFISERLQSKYIMPLREAEEAAKQILITLKLQPGSEAQAKKRQLLDISWELTKLGRAYLKKHPLPQKVDLPPITIPTEAWKLPKELQYTDLMVAFGKLHKAKLVSHDEFVALYQALPGKTLIDSHFEQQMEVYQWLKTTDKFTRSHFIDGIRANKLSPDIVKQLLQNKASGANPADHLEQLITTPILTPAAFRELARHKAQQQMLPPVQPSGSQLTSFRELLHRPGMENFGNTCYFNSACQQLSLSIPSAVRNTLRTKPMNPESDAIRNVFCTLMDLLTTPDQKNQQHQSHVQKELLQACFRYGKKHPESDISKMIKSSDVSRLSQEDAAEFTVLLSNILSLQDHNECSLRTASQFALTIDGKRYSRIGRVEEAAVSRNISIPPDIENRDIGFQECMNYSVQTELLDGENKKQWTFDELKDAGCSHAAPGLYPTEKSFLYMSDDLSQLKTHTMSLGVFSHEWDESLKDFVEIKKSQSGRKAIGKNVLAVTMPVYDQRTQSLHDVFMELQSVLVHIGNSRNAGHYVTLMRSAEGQWVLKNDNQVQKTYSDIADFLAEDRHRCPLQLSYAVTQKVPIQKLKQRPESRRPST
ncbi:hypothetical protein ACH42_16840 [Endozoicomonas sp. (ex Bugula neritina AB1)]|nr:hypothetical protein ACH42_16840 [Endozoicomonas sp. (ex Bugula neritina AB1)]